MTPFRVAVIGTGHLGKIHARLAKQSPQLELVAVIDPVAAARDALAGELQTHGLASHHELDAPVDGVIIATPTQFHHAVACDFLRRGIPTLIEKPITTTLAQADELVQLADASGAVLQVGHVERFNPAWTAAAPLVTAPAWIDARRTAPFTFRSTDISVVFDLMIHDLDLVLDLAQAPVVDVQATGFSVVTPHEDVAEARLTFATGCVANLFTSRVSPTASRMMQVWGAQAWAQIDFGTKAVAAIEPSSSILGQTLQLDQLTPEQSQTIRERLTVDHLPCQEQTIAANNAIADEQHDFVEAVRQRRQPRVDGHQGRAVLALAQRIVDTMAEARSQHGHPFERPFGPLKTLPLRRSEPLRKAG